MSGIDNKNIAFVINSLEGGGAERVICNLLTIMQPVFLKAKCNVSLFLLDKAEEQQKCPEYVKKITLNANGKLLSSYFKLRKQFIESPPDIVVSFLTRSNIVCAHLGQKLQIPTAISERVNTTSHFSSSRLGFISKLMVSFFYPKADCVVPVSKGVMQDLVDNFRVNPAKCHVLHNAYDIDKLSLLADQNVNDIPQKPYIVAIGRLVKNKNFQLAISALAKAGGTRDLVVIGQGEELQSLTDLAKLEGVSSRVHFLGFKQNPYPYIKGADYLVSSSNAEGFPNGIVEAMCLGKPIVATNCPSGPAEILTDNHLYQTDIFKQEKYGIICPTDDVLAMSGALTAMEQSYTIELNSENSFARAKHFSYESMMGTFTHILSLLQSKRIA